MIRDAAEGDAISSTVAALCMPAAGEALPGRVVEAGDPGGTMVERERPVFVTDLYARFKNLCGACHIDASLKDFHTDVDRFRDLDLARASLAIKSDDPLKYMPPPNAQGVPWSKRQGVPNDPVVQLLSELEQWSAQNRPPDIFKVKSVEMSAGESFAVSDEMASRQTNLGVCIPQRGMVATQEEEMDVLDARFEALSDITQLPDTLAETDLTTLDSAALARKGVIAFAPAYPLWSEDSGKMRAIRLPRGKSVHFDKATQKFEIPDNTRFYKTFLKKIIQRDGRSVWKKIETRLIVTRPDDPDKVGTERPQALFGSYAWNEDETEARLVRDQLRDSKPFADRLFTYVVDEPRYQEIVDKKPANVLYELSQPKNKGVVRRYMIPGKQRCVECHMGSPNADFVLGFIPLQLRRRPMGEAGAYEPAGPDELNQLQRLIDYGVITGMSSPREVRGLEEKQGDRAPRNGYELAAQAYMLGNCAHCHNPRGFPSVKSPDLVELLDFLPSEKGGIFQFRLDKTSPLRRRGEAQDVEIPYITPSLRDYPAADAEKAAGSPTSTAKPGLFGLWTPKWVDCLKGTFGSAFCDTFNRNDIRFLSAPWRSLIYRNVDTPYIYADDFNVFPHMPRHSVGFDCRVPRIMGDWMVSIPAVHKKEGAEYEDNVRTGPLDTTAQPYEEVTDRNDPRYLLALQGVSERLYEYRHGRRYDYCPDRTDIVIPEALTTTDPKKLTPPDDSQFTDKTNTQLIMPKDAVPDRAHAVPSDLTDAPGDWVPRRGDWPRILVTPKEPAATAVEVNVPWALQGLRIPDELSKYAIKPIPFGVWKAKPACNYPGVKRAREYGVTARPKWMNDSKSGLKADDPIYEITPGGAVFGNICVNCHGPQADSKGLLAEAISEMTGGAARVANFKDGLLGPADQVGGNIERVFKDVAKDTPLKPQDWAARYLSWMALGGTERVLPGSVLKIVGATKVMGLPRKNVVEGSANMLALAQQACRTVLGPYENSVPFTYYDDWEKTVLLQTTGDAEMWIKLCSTGNRPVVRVPRWVGNNGKGNWEMDFFRSFFWGEDYGNNPVMNDRGQIDKGGIQPGNWLPVCIAEEDLHPANPADAPDPLMTPTGEPVPVCPSILFAGKADMADMAGNVTPTRALRVLKGGEGRPPTLLGGEEWAARGAAGAGIAVLTYLREVRKGTLTPVPAYDRCEQLEKK